MRFLIAMVTLLALSMPAKAADELTVKPSKYPVKETLDTPVARIDHAAAAEAAGLELKPTEILLFGNPKLGTPLMQACANSVRPFATRRDWLTRPRALPAAASTSSSIGPPRPPVSLSDCGRSSTSSPPASGCLTSC